MQKIYVRPFNKDLSRIGLGCVTFGREISRHESMEILDYATDSGITHFDTSPSYGHGASETILGEWLSRKPSFISSIVIATKIQPPYDRDSIISSVDSSLAHLQIEAIDLLYLHQWHPSVNSLVVLETLNALVTLGKVKRIGASNFSGGQLQQTIAMQKKNGLVPLGFIQNNNNYAIREVDAAIRSICKEGGINIVTYSPLGAGYLIGKHRSGIEEGSRFDLVPQHAAIYSCESSEQRLSELLSIADRTCLPSAHLALSWAFQQPGISSVLIGARTKKHVEQALYSIDHPFDEFKQDI